MIKRILKENILKNAFQWQVLIIQGPRQVGKTTLSLEIVKDLKIKGVARIFNLSRVNSPRLAAVPFRKSCFDTSQLAAG